jgi:OOP family OmpA-OmpF porin
MKRCKNVAPLALFATLGMLGLAQTASAGGTGLMVGAGGYLTSLDGDFDVHNIDLKGLNFDDESFAYNLDAGWRPTKWLVIDGGYWDLGNYDSDKINGRKSSADVDAWTLGGMVSVPLWIIDVYARGGAAWWSADGRFADDDGTDVYYGLGGALNLGGTIDLYAEWVRFDLAGDLDTFGIGVRMTF